MATPTYYAKFGEFVHWYSAVERIIHYLFRHYSGLPDNVARAIDGGMSVSGLLSIINRMIVALKIPNNEQQQIKTIFDHINHITKLRDSLIHRGSESIGDVVYSTNIHLAKSPVDIEILELNISDIHN
ncbi:MAG TPA: hypothetical protein VMU78_06470, partial [Methylocella sp.]|nr:hypothetical protein [Methylocella sp.]